MVLLVALVFEHTLPFVVWQAIFAGKSSSHPTKTSSQTSLLSSSSEQSMDCNLHLVPIKPDVLATRNQDGGTDGGGSNSNMSTGSDYCPAPAPAALASESGDKIGKIKVGQLVAAAVFILFLRLV